MKPVVQRSLQPPPHYHLGRTFSAQAMGRRDPSLRLSQNALDHALWTGSGPAYISVHHTTLLDVKIWGPGAKALSEAVSSYLGLDDPAMEFRPREPRLRSIWKRSLGTYLPRLPTVTSYVVRTVLQQLVTGAEAKRAWRLILKHCGEEAPGPGDLTLPPRSQHLGALSWEQLVAFGVPHRQARTVVAVARSAARLEAAAKEGGEALSQALLRIPGVGLWTDGYVRGNALAEPDAVVVGDFHLPHAVAWNLAGEERGTDERMLELLAPHRPHRFRVIRALWAGGQHSPRRGPKRAPRPLPYP